MAGEEKKVSQAGKNKSFYTKLEDGYYSLMDFLQQKLRLPVYKFFVNPLEDKGIPSFPVFVFLVLAVVACAGFLLSASAPQKVPFEVSVFSEGKPIDNALVTLSCANGFTAQAYSENGVASFSNVPQTKCTITTEKEGFETRELSLTPSADKKAAKVTLQAVRAPAKEAQVVVQVVDEQSTPVAAALVSYEFADQSGSGATDENGRYAFTAAAGASVKLFVSKPDYDSVADSFVAAQDAVKQVTLKKTRPITDARLLSRGNAVPLPNDGVNSKGTGSTEYGRVAVKVSASDGSNVSYAKVTLYDDATNSLLNSAKASSAKQAEFLAVAVGKKVYVIVEADGFAQFKSQPKTVARGRTQFDAVLQPQIKGDCSKQAGKLICTGGGHKIECNEKTGECTDNGNPANRAQDGSVIVNTMNGTAVLQTFLEVSVADQNNKSVSAASVTLLDNDNAPRYNAKTNAKGIALFSNITVGTRLTVAAFKEGFLPFWSEQFDAGAILYYNASLARADESNSATVKVKAVSYNGTPVAKAAVALFVNDRLWDFQGSKTTDSNGIASYAGVPVGANASVNVSTSDGFIASNKTKVVKGENLLEAILLTPSVTVAFKAVDFTTNKEVTANLSLYVPRYGGGMDFVDNCTTAPSEPCVKDLYALVPYKIVAQAPDYAVITDSFVEDDASVNQTSKTIQMFKKSDKLVEFIGLYDDANLKNKHNGDLVAGNKYYASFRLRTLNNSNKTVFFVRAGKKSGTLNDQAAIIKLNVDNGNTVFSPNYGFKLKAGKTTSDCANSNPPYDEGLYKWVEAELPASAYSSDYVRFSVPVLALASDAQQVKFKLYYRAYAVLDNSYLVIEPTGDYIIASNVDSNRCDWNASQENFTVASPYAYVFSCEPYGLGCLNVSVSQQDKDGKTITRGEGFVVRVPETAAPKDYLNASFALKYLFNPPVDAEEAAGVLSLSFNTKNFQYGGVSIGGNYNVKSGSEVWFDITPRTSENNVEGSVLLAPISAEGGSSTITTKASVGDKEITVKELKLILNPPEGLAEFAPLPQGYYLKFTDNFDAFDLVAYNDTNKRLDAIDLYVDPIFPADAVELRLYPYKLPADCTNLELSLLVSEDYPVGSRNCLSYDNIKKLLKYDASKRECAAYSSDPNKVNEASFNITVFPTCLGSHITASNPAKVKVRVHANNQYPAIFAEPSDAANYTFRNCYGNAELYFLVNNRQYGDIGTLTITSSDGSQNKINFKESKRVTPIVVNKGESISLASEGGTPYSTINHSTVISLHGIPRYKILAEKILLETVFRRANYSNPDLPSSLENSMPFSVFADKLDFHFVQNDRYNGIEVRDCGTREKAIGTLDFAFDYSGDKLRAYPPNSVAWNFTSSLLSLSKDNYLQKPPNACTWMFDDVKKQLLCGDGYTSCGYCVFPASDDNAYDRCVGDGVIDYYVLNRPPLYDGPGVGWFTYDDNEECDYVMFASYKGAHCESIKKQMNDGDENHHFLGVTCGPATSSQTPRLLHGPTCSIVSFHSSDWCAYSGNVENPKNDEKDCTDHPFGTTTTYWETYDFFNPVTKNKSQQTICRGYACDQDNCGPGTGTKCVSEGSKPPKATGYTTFGYLTLSSQPGYYRHLKEWTNSDDPINHVFNDLHGYSNHGRGARLHEIVAGPEAITKRCLYSDENSQACDNQFNDSLQFLWNNEQDVTEDCGEPFNGTWRKENRCCIDYHYKIASKAFVPWYYCDKGSETAEVYLGDLQQYLDFRKNGWLFKRRGYVLWFDNYAMPACVCVKEQ